MEDKSRRAERQLTGFCRANGGEETEAMSKFAMDKDGVLKARRPKAVVAPKCQHYCSRKNILGEERKRGWGERERASK